MRRVMIIGGPGSGKSTLAREIGARLGLPVVHLDQIYWSEGWVLRDYREVEANLRAVYDQDAWVIDGNYSDSWKQRLARADTLIVLDLPTWRRFARILWRTFRTFGRVRNDLAPGCPERIDLEFWRFVLGYQEKRRPAVLALFERAGPPKVRHLLAGKRAVRDFLRALPEARALPAAGGDASRAT